MTYYPGTRARQRTGRPKVEDVYEAAQLSPDGRHIAYAGHDRSLYVAFSTPSPVAARVDHHTDWITAFAWSPTSRYIATVSDDRTLHPWDTQSHIETGVIGLHRDRITDVEWISAGDHVLTASFDGTARIWPIDVDLNDLRAQARSRAYRSLTAEERPTHQLPAH